MLALIGLAGCGSGPTSEEPEYETDAEGCVIVDPDATFEARIEPCEDAGCTTVDTTVWFPDLDEEDTTVVDITLEATCVAQAPGDTEEGARVWRLGNCEGPAAPPSASIVLELNAETMPAIAAGDEVRVGVHWRRSPYGYSEHRSWSLRTADGDLLLLHSSQDNLPPAAFAAPFAFSAEPQECVDTTTGAPVTGRMQVEVEVDGDRVVIPAGHRRVVGDQGEFLAVVERASYASNMQGILGGWTRFRILVVSGA